jgi:hypothetical protein
MKLLSTTMDMRRNSCHLDSNHSMLIAVPSHRPARRQVRYLTTNSEDTDTYSMYVCNIVVLQH